MRENSWLSYTDEDDKNVEVLAGEYKEFLSKCKTERECTEYFTKEAEACGYQDLNKLIAQGTRLKAGDKVYGVGMGKTIALFQIGKQPLTEGMNILCAHIDSPRLDLKQNPLYEDTELSFMDTHYYGGIKKYQWVALPLALHGVVAKKDGTVISVNVGESGYSRRKPSSFRRRKRCSKGKYFTHFKRKISDRRRRFSFCRNRGSTGRSCKRLWT